MYIALTRSIACIDMGQLTMLCISLLTEGEAVMDKAAEESHDMEVENAGNNGCLAEPLVLFNMSTDVDTLVGKCNILYSENTSYRYMQMLLMELVTPLFRK